MNLIKAVSNYSQAVFSGFDRAASLGPLSTMTSQIVFSKKIELAGSQILDLAITPFLPSGDKLFMKRVEITILQEADLDMDWSKLGLSKKQSLRLLAKEEISLPLIKVIISQRSTDLEIQAKILANDSVTQENKKFIFKNFQELLYDSQPSLTDLEIQADLLVNDSVPQEYKEAIFKNFQDLLHDDHYIIKKEEKGISQSISNISVTWEEYHRYYENRHNAQRALWSSRSGNPLVRLLLDKAPPYLIYDGQSDPEYNSLYSAEDLCPSDKPSRPRSPAPAGSSIATSSSRSQKIETIVTEGLPGEEIWAGGSQYYNNGKYARPDSDYDIYIVKKNLPPNTLYKPGKTDAYDPKISEVSRKASKEAGVKVDISVVSPDIAKKSGVKKIS